MNQNNKKKVLFVIPKGVGGAQKMSILISQLLPTENYIIKYVFVGKKNDNDMSNIISDKNLIKRIVIKNVWDFLTLRLIKIIKKEQPDIVFSSMMYLNTRVIIAARVVGNVKIVIRNDNMLKTQRWDKLFLMRLTYKMADIIIAQQEEMKEELINVLNLNDRQVVIRYNPVNKNHILVEAQKTSPYNDNNTTKYIWTGNFMPTGSKGQDILVKAFKFVKKRIPNAHLYLLGECFEHEQYFKDIKSFVINNKLTDSIHFVGFQENPYPWVKNADCFILPSRIEGLPNALIEAMLLAKPVVATTCIPIIKRIIKDGYNGILVCNEDYHAMAEAMINALKLTNFEMTYHPSTEKDFIELF